MKVVEGNLLVMIVERYIFTRQVAVTVLNSVKFNCNFGSRIRWESMKEIY